MTRHKRTQFIRYVIATIRRPFIKDEVVSAASFHDIQGIFQGGIEAKIFGGFPKARNGNGGEDGHNAQGNDDFDERKTVST
jgi:hypothetical protein